MILYMLYFCSPMVLHNTELSGALDSAPLGFLPANDAARTLCRLGSARGFEGQCEHMDDKTRVSECPRRDLAKMQNFPHSRGGGEFKPKDAQAKAMHGPAPSPWHKKKKHPNLCE